MDFAPMHILGRVCLTTHMHSGPDPQASDLTVPDAKEGHRGGWALLNC